MILTASVYVFCSLYTKIVFSFKYQTSDFTVVWNLCWYGLAVLWGPSMWSHASMHSILGLRDKFGFVLVGMLSFCMKTFSYWNIVVKTEPKQSSNTVKAKWLQCFYANQSNSLIRIRWGLSVAQIIQDIWPEIWPVCCTAGEWAAHHICPAGSEADVWAGCRTRPALVWLCRTHTPVQPE